MELKLTPVENIKITFAFSLVNKERDFNGTLTYRTVAYRQEQSLTTISADNAFYNALFGGLFNKDLTEEEEMEYNHLFEQVSGLEVSIEDTETNKQHSYYFGSLYSKKAVIDCDTMIAEMLNEFN